VLRNHLIPWAAEHISDDLSGNHWLRRAREFLSSGGLPVIDMYLSWVGYFSSAQKQQMYTAETRQVVGDHDAGAFLRKHYDDSEGLDPVNRLAYVDLKSFLCCNVLEYADRMSMAHALELRSPLTDHQLVEFALRVPFKWKYRQGQTKWLLRRVNERLLPPQISRKPKIGFNAPMNAWLNHELAPALDELLSPARLRARGLFRGESIRGMIDQHRSEKRDYSLHLWALIMLEIWFLLYIDGESCDAVAEQLRAAVLC
jgi:asparagine synthase (glutamine-hydrolysing)